MTTPEAPHPVFRAGGVSYLRIPAPDPVAAANFYAAAFGWKVGGDPSAPSFEDGSGHVIGHFRADLAVAGEAGVIPYVYVADIDAAVTAVTGLGALLVTPPSPEGDLWVAYLHDPSGNLLGLWQHGPRRGTTA